MIPLPIPLRPTPSFPFVGRDRELAALSSLWDDAAQHPAVALVSGEPGSGKTRLVRELAQSVADGGATVLYGSCDAVVATPYEPFVEALEHLVDHTPARWLRDDLGAGGGELTRLVPNLRLAVESLEPSPAADADTERHRLHTAVTEFLTNAGRRDPILLVVDDLHWADPPTLHLLRHLVRRTSDTRLLVVATFRDTERDMHGGFGEALADLRRVEGIASIGVARLGRDDVIAFVASQGPEAARDDVVRIADVIVNQTSGNAFMVCQIWQALVETGALDVQEKTLRLTGDGPLGLPQTVRDVLGQRLARLSPGTIDVLQVAALTGIEFELGALREAAELEGQALVDAIDEATQSGILEELPGARLASRFVHELMRRALAELPTAARRADIHRRIGEALERTRTAGRARALADLAHHFTEAAPLIGPEKAISYDLQAADAATASLAYEDAARLLSDAVTLGIDDEIERASVLLATGRARWRAGHLDGSLAAFEDSLELARAIGATEVLAQAAIGHEEACWPGSISDRGAAEFLAEAAGALHPAESPTLVRVLAGLARALAYEGRHDEAVSRQREAVEMARRLGDDQSLAIALLRSYWVRATQPLDEVLQMLTEARDLGEASNDAATHSEALEWRVRVLAELGQLDAAKAEADVMRGVAGATREAVFLHIAELFASALALVDGRLDDAESLAWASREWSHLFSGPDASAQHAIQLFCIRREQDRLGELAPVARVLAADSHAEMWRPGLAVLLAELGMTEEARREVTRLCDDLDGIPRDGLWLAALTFLADACAVTDDPNAAARLYEQLKPFAGSNVIVGQLVACYGAADRYLGVLAHTMSSYDDAERHFEDALELNRQMGATTWLAHTRTAYARMLLARGESGDRHRAEELVAAARETAHRHGLRAVERRLRELETPAAAVLPDDLSPREAQVLRLVASGLSNREIGEGLHISQHTVASHVRKILAKTGCANRTEATSYGHRRGLV